MTTHSGSFLNKVYYTYVVVPRTSHLIRSTKPNYGKSNVVILIKISNTAKETPSSDTSPYKSPMNFGEIGIDAELDLPGIDNQSMPTVYIIHEMLTFLSYALLPFRS